MSTMTDTSLDIDLATLVGPMDEVECEHSEHGTGSTSHDEGPATHYIQIKHAGCTTNGGTVYAACAAWVRFVTLYNGTYRCTCGANDLDNSTLSIVGKVNE